MSDANSVIVQTSERLLPYIARPVLSWVANRPGDRYTPVEGTLTFLDISGFTKLSERLARQGKIGAEQLAESISLTFSSLLALARANGGSLLKFGGDALLLLYTGPHHEQRACRAAIEMRRALREVGKFRLPGGQINLRMSVGMNSGVFDFFLVGRAHRELLIAGAEATMTCRMEGAASAGQILVSQTTAARLPASLHTEGPGGGRLLRRAPDRIPVFDLAEEPVPNLTETEFLSCVPVALREMLLTEEHPPEHRRATLAFVHFEDTDELIEREGGARAAELLDELITVVQEQAERHEVTFLSTDVDANGGKIILVAGAPAARGDDEERMLRTLRGILDARTAVPVRIGTNRGNVFMADVGPATSRSFNVMGDPVNLAARVMSKAQPGQLLGTPAVIDRSTAVFELTAVEPFMVKGKSRPVQAYIVGDLVASDAAVAARPALPLVGRAAELDRMLAALEAVRGGVGTLLEIIGEIGIGKTRILAELSRHAAGVDGLVEHRAHCQPYESNIPYAAIRGPVQALLGIPTDRPASERAEALCEALYAADPALVVWAPLIAPVVDTEVPETPETAAFDPRFRAERLGWALESYVTATLRHPVLLTIEDTHWMDEASAGVLASLARSSAKVPLLICTTRRPQEGGFQADSAQSLVLPVLDDEAAHRLVHLATEASPLAPHVTAQLVQRAGGNPLYLSELASAVAGRDFDSLPDTVEALITSRIDRLPPDDRRMLREVSVLGQSFPSDWLESLLGRPATVVLSRLGEFLYAGPDGVTGFQHALVREAAYEGLPFRARRQLHADVAQLIVKTADVSGEGTEDRAALLSLHYINAQMFEEAWTQALVAARRAHDLYANPEAAELYERALQASRRVPGLDPVQMARVHESLGDVRCALGAYELAEAAHRTADRILGDDRRARAQLHQKVGLDRLYSGRYRQGLQILSRGLKLLDGEEGSEATRLRARIMASYAGCCEMKADHRRTVIWSRRAIEEAEPAGELEALADGLRMLDFGLSQMGQLKEPENLRRAVQIYDDIGDLSGKARALNMLAAVEYWRGDWNQAVALYEESRLVTLRTGNQTLAAVIAANIGEVLLDQGRLDGVAARLSDSARIIHAAGMAAGEAFVMYLVARLALLEGRYDDAVRLFDEAIDEGRSSESMHEVLDACTGKAETLVASGRLAEALELATSILEQAHSLGGAPQTPRLYRVRAVAHARQGRPEEAEREFALSLEAARERSADYEMAQTQAAQSTMIRRLGLEPPEDMEVRSASIFRQLGVVSALSLYGSG